MTEEQLFLAALDLPDAAARSAYLDEVCGGDAQLRGKVERLLAAHFQSGEFLDVPAPEQIKVETGFTNAVTIESQAMSAAKDSDNESESLDFLSATTRPDSLGRIGHYEVLQVLGKGGFGIVLRAFDDVLQRVVAVKVMAPQLAATSPARKRFLREARTSAQVRHENVVQVYEVGEQPLPYLVMEFIPGETLQQRLDRTGPLDVPESLRIGRQIAEGLAAAHAQDLIHRDIKPGNVLLEGAQHKVKITDFGLARAADDASMTQSGTIAGTPMYMAPEQALGHTLDQRADLFSLGSVLYQMVAGRAPFRANTTIAVLKRVAEDTPRNIREVIPETPQWLCDIIAKLHEKDPDKRYQSAREVADVLADCETQLKANAKLKDYSRIPRSKRKPSGRKWVAAAAALLLPLVALAVTELAGVTHLLRKPPAKWVKADGSATGSPANRENIETALKLTQAAAAEYEIRTGSDDREKPLELLREPVLRWSNPAQGEVHGNVFLWTRGGRPYVVGSLFKWFTPFTHNSHEFQSLSEAPLRVAFHGKPVWNPTEAGIRFEAVPDAPAPAASDAQRLLQLEQIAKEFACTKKERDGAEAELRLLPQPIHRYAIAKDGIHAGALFAFVQGTDPDLFLLIEARGNDASSARWHFAASRMNSVELRLRHRDKDIWKADILPWNDASDRSRPYMSFRFNELPDLLKEAGERPTRPGPLPPTFKNSLGMKFVLIPKGKSWLGGGNNKLGDKEVEIPADFYLGKYEVTQEEWEKVMGENPSHFSRSGPRADAVKDIGDADLKRFPVENVSWDQSQAFVVKLNKLEKESGWVYRLPTEVEWEYACRGGPMSDRLDSAFDFYFARPTNTPLPQQANFDVTELKRTCNVGSYGPNVLGLHEMHGNVWEWCEDGERADDGTTSRVGRGGCWSHDHAGGRAGFHNVAPQSVRYYDLGLRLARVPVGDPSPEATPPLAIAPFTDADVQRIAALPAAEQVEEVRNELMRRNLGFDGQVGHKIEGGVVTEIRIVADTVTDVSPLRVFNSLRVLDCSGTMTNLKPHGQLAELTLSGKNLERLTRLNLANTRVSDAGMVHFQGCKNLMSLHLASTPVGDAGLANFKDCKNLLSLGLSDTKATDAGLAHFKDCKNLTELNLSGTKVTGSGLAHFKDCKNLQFLHLSGTKASDSGMAHFESCKGLTTLNLAGTQVSEAGLAHFKDCRKLTRLVILYAKVTDLSVLKAMPLKELDCDFRLERDAEILRSITTLEKINGKPIAQFWRRYDKGEFAIAPFTDADAKRIAALPADKQVEEVRKELVRLNPGFEGQLTPTIESGVVTQLSVNTDAVTNIAPVRALTALIYLDVRGTYPNKGKLSDLSPLNGTTISRLDCSSTQVADLSPLAELPLKFLHFNHNPVSDLTPLEAMPLVELGLAETRVLDLSPLKGKQIQVLGAQLLSVTDLSPLAGMPLKGLDLYHTVGVTSLEPLAGMPLEGLNLQDVPISDLSPLKGMTTLRTLLLQANKVSDLSPLAGLKLTDLILHGEGITDLSPLAGLPLSRLHFYGTGVSDLTPLKGMPLVEIRLNPKNITQGLDILREIKSLQAIGIDGTQAWPTAEFWQRYDKGEFKQ